MTAYVFAAEGFEEIELIAPADILRRGGVDVKLVGVTGKTVRGSHGIEIRTDISCAEVSPAADDCLILPGGMPGVTNLFNSNELEVLLDEAVRDGRLIGAICAAPSILQRRGYLAGRQFACYPGFADANLTGTRISEPVVCDGRFITASGAGVSLEFGRALLAALKGKTVADQVLTAMMGK